MTWLRWSGVLLAGVALTAPFLLTTLSSYRLVIIDGGSMEPTYSYGDVLVAETALAPHEAEAALTPGTVVIVGGERPSYVHRVVEVRTEGRDRVATLRGDANATDDPMDVTADDVYGVPVAHMGGALGDVVHWGISRAGRVMVGIVLIAALWAPWMRRRNET